MFPEAEHINSLIVVTGILHLACLPLQLQDFLELGHVPRNTDIVGGDEGSGDFSAVTRKRLEVIEILILQSFLWIVL